jgi:hypothetical protein
MIALTQISEGVTNSLNAIRTSIQEDIGTMNNLIQSAVRGINVSCPCETIS